MGRVGRVWLSAVIYADIIAVIYGANIHNSTPDKPKRLIQLLGLNCSTTIFEFCSFILKKLCYHHQLIDKLNHKTKMNLECAYTDNQGTIAQDLEHFHLLTFSLA